MARNYKTTRRSGEIQTEYDGHILHGWWRIDDSLAGRKLDAYFNNFCIAVDLSNDCDVEELAARLFSQLVEENYISIDRIDSRLPLPIREAAHKLVNGLDITPNANCDYDPFYGIVRAFGDQPIGSITHKRVSCLCLNALKIILPAWLSCCDNPSVAQVHESLTQYMYNDVEPENWDRMFEPVIATRDGVEIKDCIICMVGPIASGIVLAAKYIRTGNLLDASNAVLHAWEATDEGAWRRENMTFQQWLVFIALPASYECRQLDEDEFRN